MDEIEQLRQRVQELEKERAESQPIYVSDLEAMRIPITPMKGFVRMLIDDEKEEWFTREDRQEYYKIIEENIDRLERALNDLIAVGRIRDNGPTALEMNWQEVDIRPILEEVVKIQQARTNKHSLVLDCEPERIVIETDPKSLPISSTTSSATRSSLH
jgi:signal transduction histidine kinase